MYLNITYLLLMLLWPTIIVFVECKEYRVTDQIYFDINLDGEYLGRIVLGLFGDVAPKTVKNFKQIAINGVNGATYVGTKFHTAIPRIMILGGDIVNNDGTGSVSIYGDYFDDESFRIQPEAGGLLVMANRGPNTNGCQFFITTMAAPWLEGKNVVFGKVLSGIDIVHQIEHLKTDASDKILSNVVIVKAGVIYQEPFYEAIKTYEMTFWAWIKAGWFPLSFSFAIMGFFQYLISKLNSLG